MVFLLIRGIICFMSFENPFDDTVWDPVDKEQAIEDPLHGPEARLQLLSIPPMPRGDGTYYIFGGSYVCGANYFDANGKPFNRIGSGLTADLMREVLATSEWIKKYHAGELPSLEEMNYPAFDFEARPYLVFPSADE